MRRRKPAVLPFRRDQSARFLPMIVAVMVFLGVLTAAFAILASHSLRTWDSQLAGRLTIQIPPLENGADAARLDMALEAIRGVAGVKTADLLSPATVSALLEPWIGDLPAATDLPLPHLIDVAVRDARNFETTKLAEALATVVPGASVDDHRIWLGSVIKLAGTIRAVAILTVAIIGLSAVATVVFTTRSGLAIHAPTIELLHLMGAPDSYIASLFQQHALGLGLRGSVLGAAVAAIILFFLSRLADEVNAGLLPALDGTATDFLLVLIVPAATIFLVMITARITVLRALARMA